MERIGGELLLGTGAAVPLSLGVRVGDFVFVSGQLALRHGRIVGSDIRTQTATTLDNVAGVLAQAGLTLADVCKVTVWLTNAEDFPAFNAIYAEHMSVPFPARSTVVAELLLPGALIEIEVIAYRRVDAK